MRLNVAVVRAEARDFRSIEFMEGVDVVLDDEELRKFPARRALDAALWARRFFIAMAAQVCVPFGATADLAFALFIAPIVAKACNCGRIFGGHVPLVVVF